MQNHLGCKKWGQVGSTRNCLFVLYMWLKGLISRRGQAHLRFNHFMQLFTITYKQTAGIVVANNNLLELQWLMQECSQDLYNNSTPQIADYVNWGQSQNLWLKFWCTNYTYIITNMISQSLGHLLSYHIHTDTHTSTYTGLPDDVEHSSHRRLCMNDAHKLLRQPPSLVDFCDRKNLGAHQILLSPIK